VSLILAKRLKKIASITVARLVPMVIPKGLQAAAILAVIAAVNLIVTLKPRFLKVNGVLVYTKSDYQTPLIF
jgi:hypothetical protein